MMDWTPYRLAQLAHAHGGPVMRGVLREQPEDFQVEEDLGFSPSGEGDHLCLLIRKRNQNTAWIADQLARLAGLKPMDVSYCGLKDRRAVTTQWFSLLWPKAELPDFSALWNADIELVAQTRNNRKLRRGAHQGNRFVITLREVSGAPAEIEERLRLIAQVGVPNYFGEQRFGIDGGNLAAGERLLELRQDAGGRGRRKDDKRESLYISALRSALFNRVLSARIEAQSWQKQRPGDVLMLDGRNSFFTPKPEDEGLEERLALLDIHASGPLCGRGQSPVSEEVAALEAEVLAPAEAIVQGLAALGLDQQRRALRLAARELAWEWLEPTVLRLTMRLTSGAFATSVLRELADLGDSSQAAPLE